MSERELGLKFWTGAAVSAVLAGLAVAFAVGFVVGQLTENTETVTVGAGEGQGGAAAIKAAPAFSAEELAALPERNWITNGGSLSNQRFSPLDEIDTDNVDELKGVWHAELDESGVAAKYSGEAQPIVYEGVMYVPTGADDVFAVDVKTGETLWKYEAKLEEQIDTVCCGWTSRGVALGDGMVFLGQLNGELVALDQRTGEVVWRKAIGQWQRGETITNAPLYYDGRVFTGVSGGEYGIRGRLTALDAKTGKLDWTFWTIPGPGETGHDTWPDDEEAWKHGGAPVWQTPAVDPELGTIYFSTGNAAPDLNGSGRPGDNLFTASIVALDASSGEYKWHFQQVHHDIWDYDAPSPVVLWDAEVDGEEVKGLSQPSKTGWLYMLDRESGEPVHGIEEKPVAQNKAEQATAATQPFPSTPPFIDQTVDDDELAEIRELEKEQSEGKVKVRRGEIFDAYGSTTTVFAPGPSGGSNWPPSSYNPETEDVYICGIQGYAGYKTEGLEKHETGEQYLASVFTLQGFGSYDGVLVAQDVATGEIEWTREFPGEACYSGTVTTAGGLVFSGRSNGELVAYDAENGEQLWSFQTGAGANATPTFFEEDGKEYVAFYAAGNSLAASAHGDELWLFSLDGELEEVAASGGEAAQGEHAGQESEEEGAPEEDEAEEKSPGEEGGGGGEKEGGGGEAGGGPSAAAGQAVFADNCSVCHGADGRGGNGGPDLTTQPKSKSIPASEEQVRKGGNGMPPFEGTLSPEEIEDVAAYVVESIVGGK